MTKFESVFSQYILYRVLSAGVRLLPKQVFVVRLGWLFPHTGPNNYVFCLHVNALKIVAQSPVL